MSALLSGVASVWNYIQSYHLFYPLYSLLAVYIGLYLLAVVASHTLASIYSAQWSIPKCVHRSFAFFFLIHLILMFVFGMDAILRAWSALPYRFGLITPYLRILPYLLLFLLDLWAIVTLFNTNKGMSGRSARVDVIG